MKLYSYWRSSATWRVRIALNFKGLPYDVIPVHLVRDGGEHRTEAFRQVNPQQQIPALTLDADGAAATLTQSVAILEYLEEMHPSPSLLPPSPLERGYVRQMVEVVNSGIHPLQNLSVLQRIDELGGDRKRWGRDVITNGFHALEELAKKHSGTYLVGDAVSLADVCLVPQMYNARRFEVDLNEFPRLLKAEARSAELEPFEKARPEQQIDAEI